MTLPTRPAEKRAVCRCRRDLVKDLLLSFSNGWFFFFGACVHAGHARRPTRVDRGTRLRRRHLRLFCHRAACGACKRTSAAALGCRQRVGEWQHRLGHAFHRVAGVQAWDARRVRTGADRHIAGVRDPRNRRRRPAVPSVSPTIDEVRGGPRRRYRRDDAALCRPGRLSGAGHRDLGYVAGRGVAARIAYVWQRLRCSSPRSRCCISAGWRR
jgi:hypothetical protein